MNLRVVFTPGELAPGELAGGTAVVVDVLRATSTIVEALANGARSVYPVAAMDDAARLARDLGRSEVLLCGERRLERIEGFDLGNSPCEFTPERVGGKVLVMSTTNGTPTFRAASTAARAIAASFLNLDAAASWLASGERIGDVTLVCAGRERRFALEDAVCAGALVVRLQREAEDGLGMNDAAIAATVLARRHEPSLEELLAATTAGRRLIELGYGDDIGACARIDRHGAVPKLHDGQLSL